MPDPNKQEAPWRSGALLSELHKAFKPRSDDGLAYEVAALKDEVRALREALVPISNILITGVQAMEEFKSIVRRQ